MQANDANIIAMAGHDVIMRHDRNTYYFVRNFGDQMQARVLILDKSGRVTVDSFGEGWLERTKLSHDEVVSALNGEGKTGVHLLKSGERVLYAAVPVGEAKAVSGVVMLVVNLADVYATLGEIRRLMMVVSAGGGLIALVAGLFLSAHFTRPLRSLTGAVQMMTRGRLDQRVNISNQDEIGQLAKAFNEMAAKLEEVDQTRRQFLANTSHELKTPLSSIKVLAQSLVDGREHDPAVYREFLQDIDAEIDRLTRLVNDIFHLNPLEDVDYPVVRIEQEVQPILVHIMGLVRGKAEQKGIILELCPSSVTTDLIWPVNQDLVACMLLNLLDNAIRYTPSGGRVKLTAEVERRELVIRVADTGEGIPPEALPHLFERFYRVDQARARGTGGTGLGLAIAR